MLNYISCKLLSKLYPSMAHLSPDAHQQGITQTCASESPWRHSFHWHGLTSCSQSPCQHLIRKHAFMTETNLHRNSFYSNCVRHGKKHIIAYMMVVYIVYILCKIVFLFYVTCCFAHLSKICK